MKRIFMVIGLNLSMALLVLGQTLNEETKLDIVEKELIQLKHDIGKAYVQRDVAALECLYADEYTVTDADGNKATKIQEIDRLKNGSSIYESTSYEDVKVRVYGDTAIVSGRGTVKGRNKTGVFHTEYYSTNIFVKRNGCWVVVAAHLSGVRELRY